MSTRPPVAPPVAGSTGASGDNLVDLIRQLTQQGSHLAEQQLALIKAEVREATSDMKAAVGSMAGAVVVGIAGLGVVLMGLAFLLGNLIDNLGLGTLLVGLAALLIAYVLYATGRKKIDAARLTPDRSMRTLERTPDAARGTLTPEDKR